MPADAKGIQSYLMLIWLSCFVDVILKRLDVKEFPVKVCICLAKAEILHKHSSEFCLQVLSCHLP